MFSFLAQCLPCISTVPHNFVAIPKNASLSVCEALGLRHQHLRASDTAGPRWAIVRDPYSRALSAYSFACVNRSQRAEACLGNARNFAEFLRLPDNDLTRPQSWWLDAPADLILRFEDLPTAFEAKFGAPLEVTHETQPIVDHDDETRDLVATRYVEDFERFGYVIQN